MHRSSTPRRGAKSCTSATTRCSRRATSTCRPISGSSSRRSRPASTIRAWSGSRARALRWRRPRVRATAVNIASRPELNGSVCRLEAHDADSKRYLARFDEYTPELAPCGALVRGGLAVWLHPRNIVLPKGTPVQTVDRRRLREAVVDVDAAAGDFVLAFDDGAERSGRAERDRWVVSVLARAPDTEPPSGSH